MTQHIGFYLYPGLRDYELEARVTKKSQGHQRRGSSPEAQAHVEVMS